MTPRVYVEEVEPMVTEILARIWNLTERAIIGKRSAYIDFIRR
jgi:hypothetical protein